jgi:hypothetical protein
MRECRSGKMVEDVPEALERSTTDERTALNRVCHFEFSWVTTGLLQNSIFRAQASPFNGDGFEILSFCLALCLLRHYIHLCTCARAYWGNVLRTWLPHITYSAITHTFEFMGFYPCAVNLGFNEPLLTEEPSSWLPGSAC